MKEFDHIVIGAGQSGLYTANQLARQGKKVALIEASKIGGSFVYTNDIPKSIFFAEANSFARSLELFRDYSQTYDVILEKREELPVKLKKILSIRTEEVLKSIGKDITIIHGRARFFSKTIVEIITSKQKILVSAPSIYVCVGKNGVIRPSISGLESINYLYQHNAFLCKEIPENLVIAGIDKESIEVAWLYASIGVKVDIFDPRQPSEILETFDDTVNNHIYKQLVIKQVHFHFGKGIDQVSKSKNKIIIHCDDGTIEECSHVYITLDEVFSGIDLGLETVGIEYSFSGIVTDRQGRTKISNIYAIGKSSTYGGTSNNHPYVALYESSQSDFRYNLGSVFLLPGKILHIDQSGAAPCEFQIIGSQQYILAISIGLTERASREKYGPIIETKILNSQICTGWVKIITKGDQDVVGLSAAGPVSNNLAALLIFLYYKKTQYQETLLSISQYLVSID